jgi:uncharacterized membrane protein YgdD (TMEM256/DUF423 family)
MSRVATVCGALGAFLAVAAGAFGAHGLRSQLEPAMLAVWATAADYQMYHSLALLALGLARPAALAPRWQRVAVGCFVAGMVLFSGSLYLLALSGVRALGMVTPLGGVLFLLGWAALAAGAWRSEH